MTNTQRRIAAKLLKAGTTRIWMDPDSTEEVSKAITRDDVRKLIVKNIIQAKQKIGVSRGRAKELVKQRKKGRRKGAGKRRGTAKARDPPKRVWINKVRALRQLLKSRKTGKSLSNKEHRELYKKVKGGFFRSKSHLSAYMDKMKKE